MKTKLWIGIALFLAVPFATAGADETPVVSCEAIRGSNQTCAFHVHFELVRWVLTPNFHHGSTSTFLAHCEFKKNALWSPSESQPGVCPIGYDEIGEAASYSCIEAFTKPVRYEIPLNLKGAELENWQQHQAVAERVCRRRLTTLNAPGMEIVTIPNSAPMCLRIECAEPEASAPDSDPAIRTASPTGE